MASNAVHVLLIEDSPGDARLVREMLADTAAPFQLEWVDRLSEGLARLAAGGIQVVLLDLGLADCQGVATFATVRSARPGLPVVVLSGVADEEVAIEAVQAGAQDYLVKGHADGELLARALRYAIERARAEQALRESEERFRALVETSSDWVWQVDENGRYTYSSPRVADLLGYRPEEVLGRTRLDLVAPADAERLPGAPATCAGFEITAVHKRGRPVVLESSWVPVFDAGGRPAGYRGIDRDISERKRAAQTSAYLAAIVDSSEDAIIGADLDGMIVSWNPAAEKLYGYTAAEAIGRTITLLSPADRPEEGLGPLARSKHGECIEQYETAQVRKDGRLIDVAITASPIKDAGGRVVGASAIVRDITERKRADRELRESELRYRTLFNGVTDAVSVHIGLDGPPGRFIQVNDVLARQLGYSPEELLRLGPLDIRAPQDEQRLLAESKVLFETEYIAKHGGRIPVEINARLIQLDGQPAVLSVARDISERKRMEAEIRAMNAELERRVRERTAELVTANEELEAFTYSVSHDLRAPLRHLAAYSGILRDDFSAALPAAALECVNHIEAGSRQMTHLVEVLLNLSRLGRRGLERRRIELKRLVEEVRMELLPECGGRNIDWRIGDLPVLACDPELMRQVFANLLLNAIKFTRPRERAVIEVGTREMDREPVVFVRDNGVGFDMKDAGRLFGVFERLHRAEEFEGTGVGLATVQRIVRKHGGRVWAESAPGMGATFYFTLGPPTAGEFDRGQEAALSWLKD